MPEAQVVATYADEQKRTPVRVNHVLVQWGHVSIIDLDLAFFSEKRKRRPVSCAHYDGVQLIYRAAIFQDGGRSTDWFYLRFDLNPGDAHLTTALLTQKYLELRKTIKEIIEWVNNAV